MTGLIILGCVAFVLAVLGGIAAGALTSYSSARLDDLLEKRVPDLEARRSVRRRLDADLDRDLDLAAASRLVSASGEFTLAALATYAILVRGSGSPGVLAGALAGLLVFGELAPRIVGVALAERVVLGWTSALRKFLAPVLLLGRLPGSGRRLAQRLSGEEEQAPDDQIEDEVLTLVEEGRRDGVLKPEAEEMIASIFDFRDLAASNVMTPRIEMTALDANMSLEAVCEVFKKEGYSRYPVCEGTRDNIIGVLYVKDLVRVLTERPAEGGDGGGPGPALRDLVRPAYFVPETRKVDGLLAEMRRRRVHFAVVLDEYGGTAGIVTMEDIVEEVFGEIEDEFDAKTKTGDALVVSAGEGAVEADGRIPLRDLGDALGVELSESEEYNTLGGFVVSQLGRIPQAGEQCTADGVEVRVLAADERRVLRARVARADAEITERPGRARAREGIAMPVRTEAIVLRTVDFSNTSRVLALYTEHAGQVRAIAKGIRRRRALFAPMDLFSLNEVVYYPRRGLSLAILKESFELDAHRALGASLAHLYAASAAAELLLWGTEVGEDEPGLWPLARGVFERLARASGSARAVLVAFTLGLLKRTGHGPVLDRCAECGARGRRSPAYVPAAGGLVCLPCRREQRMEGFALGREVVEALGALDAAGGEDLWRVSLSSGTARRILVALLAHAQRAFEAPLDVLRLAEERAA